MEAFARGFLATDKSHEVFVAECRVSRQALTNAREGLSWGEVVLIEVEVQGHAHEGGRANLLQPILLSDCLACWLRSRDAVVELEARLEAFDDTVANALELKVDPALFPGNDGAGDSDAEKALSLFSEEVKAVDGEELAVRVEGEGQYVEISSLDKLSGAVSLLSWQIIRIGCSLELLRQLLDVPVGPENGVVRFASQIYSVLRPQEVSSEDFRIFVAAASMLGELDPRKGFDVDDFISEVSGRLVVELDSSPEIKIFAETIRKVLDNRIELTSSKIDDSGRIAQRALMIFLLTSGPEQMMRWISARPDVGQSVSILAFMLSGLYYGLGGIPASAKAISRQAFLGATVVGRSIAVGGVVPVHVHRKWGPLAEEYEQLVVSDFAVADIVKPASRSLTEVLGRLREKGYETEINPSDGCINVSFDVRGEASKLIVYVGPSVFRVPSDDVVRLTYRTRQVRKGAIQRQLLEKILSGVTYPVIASIGESPGVVGLTLELGLDLDVDLGRKMLVDAAQKLELVTFDESGGRKGAGRAAKRKASASSDAG
ncbi:MULTISPECIES: hypothetical protein [unclassified Pseudomonas]|uniref:hypothetical protein n=1 Tax=unclassified Pseudomonas TaxID=196821 RepID=UPI000B0BBDF2|nr:MULTISPECIES: hypothetical protein [unclassified Pseudomonas]QZA56405.1 hypothetical protein K2O50_10335 [Pseudomonas sp. 2hn]